MTIRIPDKLNFGGGDLVEVEYLEQVFTITRRAALKLLRAFHIRPMYVGKKAYFSLPTFQRIMFVLSLPGSPGFLFPGCAAKNDVRITKDENFITEITPELLIRASDPKILAEMAGCSGRDPGILKKFVTSADRPMKEKKE